MPKKTRKVSFPGSVLLAIIIVLAVGLGVYGVYIEKQAQSSTEVTETTPTNVTNLTITSEGNVSTVELNVSNSTESVGNEST